MDTKIYRVDKISLSLARKLVLSGELVAFPTETVYGLGGNAFCDNAIKKIFEAKGRPQDNPLIVHIDSFSKVKSVASEVPQKAEMLAKVFMPGALTLVLKKNDKISNLVTCGMDTVGVRVPSNINAQKFLVEVGVPIAAPSANTSKRPSPTSSNHVYDDLNGKIQMILDGGKCEIGIESTVLDMTADIPTILRPGIITQSQIEDVIGKVLVCTNSQDKVASPGVKYTHYAPKCSMFLFKDIDSVKKKYSDKDVIFLFDKISEYFNGYNTFSLGQNNVQASNRFYSLLRMCESDYETIFCQYPVEDEVGKSLLNRMIKACSGNII